MVSYDDVQDLLEGGGRQPGEEDQQTVFNIALERLMEDRSIETYDDL